MKHPSILIAAFCFVVTLSQPAHSGLASTAVREAAENIVSKFGKGVAGQSVEEVTDATTKAVTRYGDDALPLLRNSGHAGFTALEEAGAKAPDIIKLYARKGDEAIWLISEPKKLAIFIKHGDSAADALLKHPGIADSLIGQYGGNAVGAMNSLSRQNAQRLSMGLLNDSARSPELLPVIRQYGDEAMDFIWKNKGALAVASVLATFLADPQAYISGAKTLIVDPIVSPIVDSINWTLIVAGILLVVFLPFIARILLKAKSEIRRNKNN